MEDLLAIILIFGGMGLIGLSFSPVGRALADRLRHGVQPLPAAETDEAILQELDNLSREIADLNERLTFAERLLVDRHAAAVAGSETEVNS